jgi:hypothetical protein
LTNLLLTVPVILAMTLTKFSIEMNWQAFFSDDLLGGMDIEQISDEEFKEEAKTAPVDALDVDWASLACRREKKSDTAVKWKRGDFMHRPFNQYIIWFRQIAMLNYVC